MHARSAAGPSATGPSAGPTGSVTSRSRAADLDAADPLAGFRDRFTPLEPGLVYLDGNSLGMLPAATAQRLAEVISQDWGAGLIRSWAHWVGLPRQAGDLLGEHLLGAAPGQVVVCDSTTVNLYKLACAALDARPGRPVLVTDDDNFPTDRYVLEGIAARSGGQLRMIRTRPGPGDPPGGRPRRDRAGHRPGLPVARGLPERRAGRHGRDHPARARRGRAGALGPVPLGGLGPGGPGRLPAPTWPSAAPTST